MQEDSSISDHDLIVYLLLCSTSALADAFRLVPAGLRISLLSPWSWSFAFDSGVRLGVRLLRPEPSGSLLVFLLGTAGVPLFALDVGVPFRRSPWPPSIGSDDGGGGIEDLGFFAFGRAAL